MLTYGASYPGIALNFVGFLDSLGQATATFNVPLSGSLVGLDLHAAAITLDPLGPLGLGLVSNAASTTLVSPLPVVSAVGPASGPAGGGTNITIAGAGFLSGATVTVGNNSATSVAVVGPFPT